MTLTVGQKLPVRLGLGGDEGTETGSRTKYCHALTLPPSTLLGGKITQFSHGSLALCLKIWKIELLPSQINVED